MKVWYSKKWDMYGPTKDWWEDGPNDLVEVDIRREIIVCEGGSNEPYCHAGRWEQEFCDDAFCHSILTKIPWKSGKYRIIIEEI